MHVPVPKDGGPSSHAFWKQPPQASLERGIGTGIVGSVLYARRSVLGIETGDQARAIPNLNGAPVEGLFGPNHSRLIVPAVDDITGPAM